MDEYNDFRTTIANIDILSEPKLILAVICSLVSKLVWQETDTVAKATEEIMCAHKDMCKCQQATSTDKKQPSPLFNPTTINDETLSTIDKAIYTVLCTLADNETRECSPKVKTIAKKASCSVRSVQKSLNNLEKHCLIRRKHRFICHRQISSLYTILDSGADCDTGYIPAREAETNTHNKVPENTSCSDEISNSTEQNPAYFEGRNKCGERAYEGCNECTSLIQHPLHTEKTLESLKIPNGGACLPTSAEEESPGTNATIPEKVIPVEKTKASLTGGALLPMSEDEKPKTPEAPGSTTGTSAESEKNPFIRAECDGTTQADNDYTAVCENPVIRPEIIPNTHETADNIPTTITAPAAGEVVIPEIPDWLMKQYEEAKKRYAELYDKEPPKPAEAPKEVEQPSLRPEIPEYGTAEFYQWKLENTCKVNAELHPPVKQIVNVADMMGDVLADIKKPKGGTTQAEMVCETPVIGAEAVCETPAPIDKVDKAINAPEPVEKIEPSESSTADNVPAEESDTCPVKSPEPQTASETPSANAKPATPDKTSAPKGAGKSPKKGKSSGGNPKDIYSPEDAPEVMRPTAEYFLFKTGRKGLRWKEIEILRELSATHYPTVVNKEIARACGRFARTNEPLECLTLMYLAVPLRKWQTFGKKKKKELSEEKKKYFAQYEPEKKEYTAEELDAIQARIDEMQARMDAREEERRRRLQ